MGDKLNADQHSQCGSIGALHLLLHVLLKASHKVSVTDALISHITHHWFGRREATHALF